QAGDGALLWQHELLAEYDAPIPRWGIACSPLVDGERVFVTLGGSKGNVVAFDRTTGKEVWKTTELSDSAGYSSPVAATQGGVRQVIIFCGGSVNGLAADSGKVLWRYDWTTSNEVNAATPLVYKTRQGDKENDYIFISSGYNKGCALLKIDTD